MSFKCWYQVLCKKGHLSEIEVYEHPNFDGETVEEHCDGVIDRPLWKCTDILGCGAQAYWWHMVDDHLAGEANEIELTVRLKEIQRKCNMGHMHVVHSTVYHLPSNKQERLDRARIKMEENIDGSKN